MRSSRRSRCALHRYQRRNVRCVSFCGAAIDFISLSIASASICISPAMIFTQRQLLFGGAGRKNCCVNERFKCEFELIMV